MEFTVTIDPDSLLGTFFDLVARTEIGSDNKRNTARDYLNKMDEPYRVLRKVEKKVHRKKAKKS